LNQAVKRNASRFPTEFLLRLTLAEREALMRSQIVTACPGSAVADASKRNIRHLPYAFTEHGALMAANILSSPQAVAMSVYVILKCQIGTSSSGYGGRRYGRAGIWKRT
jgi:hypothetical protein